MALSSELKAHAQKKRAQQTASIPFDWRLASVPSFTLSTDVIDTCGILSGKELAITAITDARVLRDQMLNMELSCVEVTTAFCKRAAVAQQLIGCCTEIFFERALKRAKELDQDLQQTGRPAGPLHGVPVSLKDSFEIEGLDTTIGWLGLIDRPATANAPAVDILLSMGAVLYVKSNIPQSLMMSDSYNHVFGQSLNALNKNLISGGSSGGEGALVGAYASIIGIGTDIGGSVRIPADLQGLYALMPSVGRVPYESSAKEQEYLVLPVAGPLTTSLSSLEFFMEVLMDTKPWEVHPRLLPIPWRKEMAVMPERKLRFAFVFDDGVVKPQPPVARAVKSVAENLQKAGHEVIEWDPEPLVRMTHIWNKAVKADGGRKSRAYCELIGEPLIEGMVVGKPEDELTAIQRQEIGALKLECDKTFLKWWNDRGIDAVIMPVMPWVSYPPKLWVKSKQWLGYTAPWNFLNYASLVMPITTVNPAVDVLGHETYEPRNDSDEFNYRQYDPELVKGMPVGVQIVTGRFGEEKAIGIARLLQSLQ
ncbi:MAG: hypothetical protein M1821_008814 [Bathelium mastoideum]|nr:MAG: hypothetical protein M1821_008814 [Bathelium mastoideum]